MHSEPLGAEAVGIHCLHEISDQDPCDKSDSEVLEAATADQRLSRVQAADGDVLQGSATEDQLAGEVPRAPVSFPAPLEGAEPMGAASNGTSEGRCATPESSASHPESSSSHPFQAALTAAALQQPALARRGCYPQFLQRFRQPSAQALVLEVRDFLKDFPANLTRPQAARRIHSFLSEATPRLLAVEAFADCMPEEAREVAAEGLERFVLLKLHKLLFRHSPADIREDERVEALLRQAIPAELDLPLDSLKSLERAVEELRRVDQYRAPRDKALLLLSAYRICEGIVVDETFRKGSASGDGDESLIHGLLVTSIVKAVPPNLASNIAFTTSFRQPSLLSEDERRCLSDFAGALATAVGGPPAAVAEPTTAAAAEEEELPPWLVDAAVSFRFEDRSAGELLLGEVDELLEEYHRMTRALRELSGLGQVAAMAR